MCFSWERTRRRARRPTVHTSLCAAWLRDLGKKGKMGKKNTTHQPLSSSLTNWVKKNETIPESPILVPYALPFIPFVIDLASSSLPLHFVGERVCCSTSCHKFFEETVVTGGLRAASGSASHCHHRTETSLEHPGCGMGSKPHGFSPKPSGFNIQYRHGEGREQR